MSGIGGSRADRRRFRRAEVHKWNALNPVGSPVTVRLDAGELVDTHTRSEAWVLGGHTTVVLLDGITGCYLLDRVTARLVRA